MTLLVEAMTAFVLALVQPPQVSLLSPAAACSLAASDGISADRDYAIKGRYMSDGMHGASFTLPDCDRPMALEFGQVMQARIRAYHDAFARKCNGTLYGDWIEGVFTGHFERKPWTMHSAFPAREADVFVVSAVETTALNAASISCGK